MQLLQGLLPQLVDGGLCCRGCVDAACEQPAGAVARVSWVNLVGENDFFGWRAHAAGLSQPVEGVQGIALQLRMNSSGWASVDCP
jgi:hypothetical protein